MSQVQNADHANAREGSHLVSVHMAEAEDTNSVVHRNALYESFRQRDAWLRKAWGRASAPILVEFNDSGERHA